MTGFAGVVYLVASVAVIGFQLALAAGAPWGELAMGGRYPGRFPPAMRAAAVVQAAILTLLALVVLDAAGAVPLGWTEAFPWLPWLPVVFATLSVVVNAISPSPRERRLWVPVGLVLLGTSLIVALTA
jgi:hypothetical protein